MLESLERGLSPRVRGNQAYGRGESVWDRSIPACAGEPWRLLAKSASTTVYPRVCGGTRSEYRSPSTTKGLSPRVRGNRAGHFVQYRIRRSIPACAGEPWRSWTGNTSIRVYPRVCGGTNNIPTPEDIEEGLSPRVRGNRAFERLPRGGRRSIPACAGEPLYTTMIGNARGVYPRVCGGTATARLCGKWGKGLSPRVRGNRPGNVLYQGNTRSIPACAGEPALKGK